MSIKDLDLKVDALEDMETPGGGEWVAGIGVGLALGGIALAIT